MCLTYFSAVAREVRELLADMGFRSLEEIIGRADLITFTSPEEFFCAGKDYSGQIFQTLSRGSGKDTN